MDLNHLIHFEHVDAHTTVQRANMPLKCGPRTVGNYGYVVASTDRYDLANLLSTVRCYNGIRW